MRQQEPGARPLTVLVADDEPMVRRVLTKMIEADAGLYLVGAAADGREAVELANRDRPDVALVDVEIPEGSGPAATRAILECSPTTRVVALSGHSEREYVTQMLAAGAVGYLVKGVDLDVVSGIKAAARGQVVLSPQAAGQVIGALSDRLVFDEQQAMRRHNRIAAIRAVIEQHDFSIAFQPIFDLRRHVVVGVEALVRFGPDRSGRPDFLFHEAWTLGVGLDLELAVLCAALEAGAERPDEVYLSVNVSPATVMSDTFGHIMSDLTHPERVVVELTEHVPVDDYDELSDRLAPIRARGTRLAVDDAGAGYASFRHVLELHPDVIKLDLSLVSDIESSASQRALASSLVGFARAVGSTVVAEGLETQAQSRCLAELGVTFGQGNLLAEPDTNLDVRAVARITPR
ncbi:MAG: EAL domain-containing response regulator [Acidimicrobiales bacterium]